ncbi:PREDICTED: putative peptidyl-tRNA hydrolase PTRHD1 [Rhagoletis zephyria]|uniref:putative peptidyl-tRNA hydrolase PTRHD1 n=1 Tax=Rhagoletis zephyria TaxID=28612 RepID=UPI00081180F4|nr:PREDICTED: putative peptidyl-tRNA hydrolase PTRHD1 [Rhagoletis zephyria]
MAATTKDLVQYIIVRGDLKWPKGALIGNGSHASVAAIFSNMNDQDTTDYLKDLDNMTKVVLKAENEEQIVNAAKTLEDNSVKHYIWREQPENIISALATAPRSREILKPLLTNLLMVLSNNKITVQCVTSTNESNQKTNSVRIYCVYS